MNFFANGKLLLTGEYAVLRGACALALPTKFGQHLTVEENNSNFINWKSLDHENKVWFENDFDINTFEHDNPTKISLKLKEIFNEISIQNSKIFNKSSGQKFITKLDFNKNFGLGSSSTLISIMCQWSGVDPYVIQKKVFGGSGYDIACSTASKPIIYNLKKDGSQNVREIDLSRLISKNLYFVYLNSKQNTRDSIKALNLSLIDDILINKVNDLTSQIAKTNSLEEFKTMISAHEDVIGRLIAKKPVKEILFNDYNGAIKSLGAWGGDFIVACGDENTPDYFLKKGYQTCYKYEHLIL